MEDQRYAKMETKSSVVPPEPLPRRNVPLYPLNRRTESQDSERDGPLPPSAPPAAALGQRWGVLPPLFPPNKPPPPYGAPGKETLERVGLQPQSGVGPGAANRMAEDGRVMQDIARNNNMRDADRLAPPPYADSQQNRASASSSFDGRSRQPHGHEPEQHSSSGGCCGAKQEEEERDPCCAGGCCGCCAGCAEAEGVGPMAKPRKCRDIFCLALLLIVWAGWLVVLWVAVTEGCPDNCNDPRRLIFGTDSETGEVCGTGAQAGKLRVYHAFPANPLSRRFCVAECPRAFSGDAARSLALGLVQGAPRDPAALHNCLLPRPRAPAAPAASAPSSANATVGAERRAGAAPCFYPTYATADILFKCVPAVPANLSAAAALGFPASEEAFTVASKFMAAPVGALGSAVAELQVTWRVVAGAGALAVLLGFLWLLLLRHFALVTVSAFAVALLAASVAVTLLAWDKAGVVSVAPGVGRVEEELDSVQVSATLAKVIATGLSVVTAVLLLLAVCLAKRLLVAVRLIREASKAVLAMPSLVVVPLSTLLATALLAALALGGTLFLASAGEYDAVLGSYSYGAVSGLRDSACRDRVLDATPLPFLSGGRNASYAMPPAEAERWCVVFGGDPGAAIHGWRVSAEAEAEVSGEGAVAITAAGSAGDGEMSVEEWVGGGFRETLPMRVSDYYGWFWLVHVVCMLWTYCFTTTCLAMVVGGAVGEWFWRGEGMPLRGLPAWRALLRVVVYQLGTAAFGGLVVALVWSARLLVQFLLRKLRLFSRMPLGGALGCVLDCCLKCIERFVKFINRNTVIMAAIHGETYCFAARTAFRLLLSNALRVATVSTASMLLLFLGKLFVVAAATAAAWAWIRFDPMEERLNLPSSKPVATLCVVAVLAWGIARILMNVYQWVIEALLLCFFEDSESENPLPRTRAIDGRLRNGKVLEDDASQHPASPAPRQRGSRRNV